MDGHLPLMALYAILALAVAVTARATDQEVREGELFRERTWLLRLLHLPVLLAWMQLGAFLLRELYVTRTSASWFDLVSLIVHLVVLGLIGLVCICTYYSQFRQWGEGSAAP